MKREAITGGLGFLLGAVVALFFAWKFYRPEVRPLEPPASAVKQPDTSLVVERAPNSAPGPAPHIIPAGGREERRIRIIVNPRPSSGPAPAAGGAPTLRNESPSSAGTACPPCGADGLICPPVRVDLSLVRMPDQTRRVVASSPDGEVVGGLDVPIERERIRRELRWAAGGTYDLIQRDISIWGDRYMGPFIVGAQVTRSAPRMPGDRPDIGAAVRFGVRW